MGSQINALQQYFELNTKRPLTKWSHYFEVYDRHLAKYRGREIVIVEIGVFHGGSLQMWKSYFGPKAKIYGIDINPACKAFEEENIHVIIGSQNDQLFLEELKKTLPPIDILIDDGGHMMLQQILTFKVLFSHIKGEGVYICEDTHTSYWLTYGGGVGRQGTFIEFSKKLIDKLNAYHSEQSVLQPDDYTKSINGIFFYDSVVVVEKTNRTKPVIINSGTFPAEPASPSLSFTRKLKNSTLYLINKTLRGLRLPGFRWR